MSASIKKYIKAFKKSQEYLDQLDDYEIPINTIEHVQSQGILVASLEYYLKIRTKSKKEFTVKDARCIYYPDRDAYLIIYNQSMPLKRIRFSIIHELAHILLGHLNDERTELDRGGLKDYIYYHYEGEANTFAGNFLAPPILIREHLNNKMIPDDIAGLFNLSNSAAKRRINDYSEWLSLEPTTHELNILNKYGNLLYPKYCSFCNYVFYDKHAKYCIICGSSKLEDLGGLYNMTYSGIELDELGRAKICPKCSNENPCSYGDHCIICGSPLVNHCEETFVGDDHGGYMDAPCEEGRSKPLPGNARFCPYCGNETTYFKKSYLPSYTEENKNIVLANASPEDFSEIVGDDELPF